MPTLVSRIFLTGTVGEVSPTRCAVVERVRAWGVPLDDERADVIRLVASELVTNAVVHGEGPVTVGLYHRPGCLVIEVHDGNPGAPLVGTAGEEDERGRGIGLVTSFAARSGWEATERGKRVWAEITLPKPAPAVRAAVLRRFFATRPSLDVRPAVLPFSLAVA
ncbi:ATP-binding protein [Streptomyces sp. NBC_00210]|uniref:ATP-binding protein n=1 Tax=unclassified Streptomyces TaxID=2593676 RepID=UPI003244C31D